MAFVQGHTARKRWNQLSHPGSLASGLTLTTRQLCLLPPAVKSSPTQGQFCASAQIGGRLQLSGVVPAPPLSAQPSPQGTGKLPRDPLACEASMPLLTSFLPTNVWPPATQHRPQSPAHNPPAHHWAFASAIPSAWSTPPCPPPYPTPAPNLDNSCFFPKVRLINMISSRKPLPATLHLE